MKISALLSAVQRIVSGIKIQYDLSALAWDRLNPLGYQQRFNLFRLRLNFMVTLIPAAPTQFQSVQGRAPGQPIALVPLQYSLLAGKVLFARQKRMHRIQPQPVMVVEIFIAQRQGVDALRH